MDINTIIKLVQSVPPDKLTDEKTLKKVIKAASKEAGKNFSDEEVEKFAKDFRNIAKGGSPLSLISALLKNGVSKNQLNDIAKKMNKK
ncbi:stage VI sporulation protein F [Ammoniphilus sp. YIM 78166]|uniref:stage VI sporulation protein F n=1 Tax=Ammoniphilus sp. YIM 78166 TaxID=1644106 RepID=UPI001430E5C5|nr:stage VI sporulation protein F [Ammoniphilus sp. YIM 78166]